MPQIKENIELIRKNIGVAAEKSGRGASEISLVCVTKQIPVEYIIEAISARIRIIGESRVEEAIEKKDKIEKDIEWHMIGHLQTRKVKDAVKMFDLIHSVDSLRLAEEIDKRAGVIQKIQDILLEVNISGEISKYGFKSNEVITSLKEISNLKNIKVLVIMTIAPFADDANLTRPVFRGLKNLKDEIINKEIQGVEMRYLSMGMTQDYTVAIEEGSNMVRIGTAIFKGV